ncbi:hypothetical protein PMY38_15995 [Clostridium tertium]|uniref:hypothetical protein n=1 Tax=Clostridium tertium TaxID=1559 RepID=UPI00232B0D51|nr:hypothetical protein [Clostridium tertium]MDB1956932.1 hypothetical protein [Clostridium tertium]MDB1960102.1 hypothetical protein [Clostridium tertium]MDB1963889.1 hypothetical protein [Clostridium tertium]MDB1967952.1 hypothetical protein [Clostridium tertium]
MSEKQNKHFYIDKDLLDYLKEVKKDNNLSSMNQAINLVLKEHKEKSKTTTELMLKIIANEVATELKNELQKIIKGVNSTDKHSQILIEMLNGFFIKSDVREILTTDIFKSEGLEIAESSVKKRIAKSRTMRLSKQL